MLRHVTFRDKDVFPDKNISEEGIVYEDRPAGRAILFDEEKNIALIGNKVNDFYLLPGGGINLGESIEAGVIRECLEETGCVAVLLKDLGVTEDYRGREKKHYINYCYVAKVVSEKGKLQPTEEESKKGMYVKWVSFDKALKIFNYEAEQLSQGKVKFYNTGFNILRDHLFLLQAKKYLVDNEEVIFVR